MAASTSSSLLSAPSLRKSPPSSLSSRLSLSSAFGFSVSLPRRRPPAPVFVVMSMDAKPTILVAEKLGEAGLKLLKDVANVDCSYNLSPEELCTKISLCDALIVRSGTKVTRDVFEASSGRLRVVGRAGVGIDNVDLAAATEHGCLVVNAPTANTVAAAEHGIALLTAMARNIAQADASVKAGKWERNKYVGVSLVGKTLAVMGFGKVGSELARRAKGLGMQVIAHDPYAPADRARAIGVELVSFDEAIATADFISLHMPLTSATSKILNDQTFAKMKKGVRIVNVARGGVIDEEALVKALDEGIVAQAALDVFTEEPPPKDSKLILHDSVTVTPHLGASTMEAQEGVAIEVAEAVVGALRGELAATAVNAPMVPAEVLTELKPFVELAEKLGRLAVQLVAGGSGVKSVKVTYASARAPDDLDTRLLRAMTTKGLIEPISSVFVNLVNADFTAKQRGLRISEERIILDGSPESPLKSIQVQIANVESKFASAISESGDITVEGRVKDGIPHLTKVGSFEVDVSLEGSIIFCRQVDQPGMIGKVGTILAEENINVSPPLTPHSTVLQPQKMASLALKTFVGLRYYTADHHRHHPTSLSKPTTTHKRLHIIAGKSSPKITGRNLRVAVVGGGPAGGAAAETLAKGGIETYLIERKLDNCKPCGGAIPLCMVGEFDLPLDIIDRRVTKMKMISPSNVAVDIGQTLKPHEYIGMVRREILDSYLRDRAASSGAAVINGLFLKMDKPKTSDEPYVLHYTGYDSKTGGAGERRKLEVDAVIGADGANSRVAKSIEAGDYEYAIAFQERIKIPDEKMQYYENLAEMYVGDDVSPDFYGWVFPKCDHVAVGTGTVTHKGDIKKFQTATRHRARDKILGGRIIRVEAHPIPEHPRPRRIADRVALVGDAAGYVTKCSGEGIYFAAKSGRMCAEAIVEGSENGKRMVEEGDLRKYLEKWDKMYWPTYKVLDVLQKVFYRSNPAREAFVEMCADKYVQKMTFDSYLYKKVAPGNPLEDLKLAVNTIGSLVRANALRREMEKMSV